MRRWLSLIFLAFVGGMAWAGDPPTPPAPPAAPGPAATPVPPPNPEPAADAVLAAVKAKDDAALRALAAKDLPDPWLVADELIRRGELDAADAFAKAAPRVDVERLPAYVASRREKPEDAAARESLARMNEALLSKDFPAALEAFGPADAAPPADVVGIRRAQARALGLHGLNRLEESAAAFLVAGDAAERLGWRRRAAFVLHLAGVRAWERSDYRGALASWERALGICELRGDRVGMAQAIGNLGSVHGALGNHAKSLEYAERAIPLMAEVGDRRAEALSIRSLGAAHAALGNHAKSLECFERALQIMQDLGDGAGVASCIDSIGGVHKKLGNHAKALELLERALKQREELGDRAGAAGSRINVGIVHLSLGSYAKALEYLERGLREAEAAGHRQWAANALNALGAVQGRLGNPQKALEHYERALDLAEALGDRRGATGALINIGGVLRDLGDFAKALECYERGLRMAEAMGDREWAANALSSIGNVHSEQGDPAKALDHYERALKLHEDLGGRLGAALALVNVARVHFVLGDHAKAIQILERAARAAEKLGANGLLVHALTGLAQVRLASGDAARALPDAHRAVSLLRSVVGGLGEEQGATAREQFTLLFSTGLAAAAKADDAPEAVFFLESGRAGTMLESLDARDALRHAAIPEALRLAEDEALSTEKRALLAYTAAQESGDRVSIRAREQELRAARAKVQEVVERIQREAKKAANLWYPVASPLEDVQGFLGSGEALVLYGLAARDAEAYAVLLTKDEARIVGLGRSSAIVEACEALDASDPHGDPAPALEHLRALLVAPLALPKETRRLLVSPEGPISYVPFAALLPDLDVVFEMSGTTYGVLLDEKGKRGGKILALGDPDYGAKFNPIALDLYAPIAMATGAAARGGRLVPLPGTREEATAVGDVTLFGRDASEAGLRAALAKESERWHSIHFACHGLVSPDRPTLSSLALTPEGEEDGFLTALEVLGLELPSDLVVLSACETGKGKIVGGEGIVGLTRAFMYAGSPRVICSLWKVDDEATRALMVRFYELWNPKDGKAGLPTAEALRKAQEFVRSQERWKHPYYWAAWVLWGLPE